MLSLCASAQQETPHAIPSDTISCSAVFPPKNTVHTDTTATEGKNIPALSLPHLSEIRDIHRDSELNPLQKVKGYGNFIVRVIDAFDDIDSNYVERIPYNFTVMLQATHNLEYYSVGTRDYSNHLSFAQKPDLRIGPYFGWKWLFLGYTFDVLNMGNRAHKSGSRFELSIYTSMFGADLIYRRTGNDFYLRHISGLEEAELYEGTDCSYISTKLIGVNVYYNFNHRRFSNPAVYSQSTIQRRSAGSWQLGASITAHDINFDVNELPQELLAKVESQEQFLSLERVKYMDYSITGGYAYNWVFKRNWCLGIALTPSIGYKYTSTKTVVLEEEEPTSEQQDQSAFMSKMDEIFRKHGNINFNVTGRTGVIYNNGRWFAGLFGVIHNFNYRRYDLRFSNTFGTINLCGGFYFQKSKSKAKDKGKKQKQ